MSEEPHDRLRKARERAGYKSASSFAREQGITESGYRHHENGTRKFRAAVAMRYAKALGAPTTWTWLIGGDAADAKFAEVLGYVGAGEEVMPFDGSGGWDPIPAPPGLLDPAAARVRGDSMLPVYREGDWLFFEKRETVTDDAIGRDCMVKIVDGPRFIKRLNKGAKRGTFRLFSYASLQESGDVRLEWAAPVAWVMRA